MTPAESPRPGEAQAGTAKLPTEVAQARRFGKTRSAQSTALLEDYVELIADLLASAGEARPTDIARRLGVSHATAIKTISRLKRAGMATARPYRGVFLTEEGMALAERVRARHRLVVDVLCALGVPPRRPKPMPRASSITYRKLRSKRSPDSCNRTGEPSCRAQALKRVRFD